MSDRVVNVVVGVGLVFAGLFAGLSLHIHPSNDVLREKLEYSYREVFAQRGEIHKLNHQILDNLQRIQLLNAVCVQQVVEETEEE